MKTAKNSARKNFLSMTVFLVGVLASGSASAKIIYVDATAPFAGDGTSWVTAYKYLTDALYNPSSGVVAGDDIWVAKGVYYPDEGEFGGPAGLPEESFWMINGVAIYGGFGGTETSREQRDWQANVSVLSGDIDQDDTNKDVNGVISNTDDIVGANSYTVVSPSNGIDSTAILDGFTVTAGSATKISGAGKEVFGGGMYHDNASPTLRNLVFSGNQAQVAGGRGGAMYNFSSSPTLTNVSFSGNAAGFSGGMFNQSSSNPTLVDVSFSGNEASFGGGMWNYESNPTLTNVSFSGNKAENLGGGMFNQSSSPTLTDVSFSGNEASFGGGMLNQSTSAPTLTNVLFSGNLAAGDATNDGTGGGLFGGGTGSTLLTNVTFTGNIAKAAATPANMANGGGLVVYTGAEVVLQNSVVWDNSADDNGSNVFVESSGTLYVRYSLIQGSGGSASWNPGFGIDKGNNLDADPMFVAPLPPAPSTGGDARLLSGSPAVDVGDNSFLPAGVTTDLAGNPRIWDGDQNGSDIVDLGPYERGFPSGDYNDVLLRDIASEWIGKRKHGSTHMPPTYTGVYNDVTSNSHNADWIQQLYNDGVTQGCHDTDALYCPKGVVDKTQAVKLILTAVNGGGYMPPISPTPAPLYGDVPLNHPDANWIYEAQKEDITTGCGDGSHFCPMEILTQEGFEKMLKGAGL